MRDECLHDGLLALQTGVEAVGEEELGADRSAEDLLQVDDGLRQLVDRADDVVYVLLAAVEPQERQAWVGGDSLVEDASGRQPDEPR